MRFHFCTDLPFPLVPPSSPSYPPYQRGHTSRLLKEDQKKYEKDRLNHPTDQTGSNRPACRKV